MKALHNKRIKFSKSYPEHQTYDIHDQSAISAFVSSQKGKHKFAYDHEFNQHRTKQKLLIAPIAMLGGRLGVYANQNISKRSKSIGCYAGRRYKKHPSNASLYVFEIQDKDERPIEHIDAEKFRDWTGFINHSVTPNLYADQRKINGKVQICFYVLKNIKKGEQLTYDYGKYYFQDSGIKPYYIHPSDNWLSDEEIYRYNQQYYQDELYSFDQHTREILRLGMSTKTTYILPKLFAAIYENDVPKLKKLLSSSPVDSLAYACDGEILPVAQQQHLTPLMFACYLGNKNAVELLLAHQADVDRCMLVAGFSPFMILMQGLASQETIEAVGTVLLRKMTYITQLDEDRRSILHFAITRNSIKLAKKILTSFDKEDFDWLELMLSRKAKLPAHADFEYCLLNGNIQMLAVLLQAGLKQFGKKDNALLEAIKNKTVFKEKTLQNTPVEYLNLLNKLLQKASLKPIAQQTMLLTRIQKIMRIKTQKRA